MSSSAVASAGVGQRRTRDVVAAWKGGAHGEQGMTSVSVDERDTLAYACYVAYSRQEWGRLRGAAPLPLSEEELTRLRGLNDVVSLQEVAEVYLPLARLLTVFVAGARRLHGDLSAVLSRPVAPVPYIIGLAGSVAVGKSTTARLLRALLAQGPGGPVVDLITTDGFLYPNAVLRERGLMSRKGFPESYDQRRLVRFLAAVKAGQPEVAAPVYSHLIYDIVPDRLQVVRQPAILIVEGLNVLQTWRSPQGKPPQVFVSDFFDLSIYVDADAEDIESWFIERFLTLRATAFHDPTSYFRHYAALPEDDAIATARDIWRTINAVNLVENLQPTRERAHLILRKGHDHSVQTVLLRKM